MMTNARSKALLIQLEFPTWETARPWTYSANFAVQEGLTENGVECVTIPIIAQTPCSSPASWVSHAKKFLAGKRFDQVWLWLVHTPLDTATLEWVADLAPIRIGILMESLSYDAEDYAWAPQLKMRQAQLETQLPYLTHVLAPDEQDATDLTARGPVKALWWPPMVPERFITIPAIPPIQSQAVFHGTPYGRRHTWINHPALHNRLNFAKPVQPPTQYQQLFDQLQHTADQFLRQSQAATDVETAEYVQTLKKVRLGEFTEWMRHLPQWPAIVNLPSLAKFYGGRVFEGMAAGRPVISWNIPGHQGNRRLFQDGHDILLFEPKDSAGLVRQIDRVLQDRPFAESLVRNAQDKVRHYHTAERRIQQTLEWLESGKAPDYGVVCSDFSQQLARLAPQSNTAQATSHNVSSLTTRSYPVIKDSRSAVASPVPSSSVPVLASQVCDTCSYSDAFYVDLFVKKAAWSTPEPNSDEAARWSKIASFLEYVVRQTHKQDPSRRLRILDVGCGRGWLTNLATAYGTCEGVEPVGGVVDYARRLFPHLRFEVGTPESVLSRVNFVPYDVVLCSEVIEHVPHADKPAFMTQLAQLLTPAGYLILTTPRGEMWEQWKTIAPPNQPVEDWVTEQQLGRLFATGGFWALGVERIQVEVPSLRYIPAATPSNLRAMSLMPIYQVWACQRLDAAHDILPVPFTRMPMVSVVVPTYNRPERLRVALESLAHQTFQDFEAIIVNDSGCSVESIVTDLNIKGRLTLINHDRNRGLAASRNTGLRAAKGTYISYLDDDDRLLPDHLETLVTFLERGTHEVAYTDAWRVLEQDAGGAPKEIGRDRPYSYEFDPLRLLVSNYIPVLCVMHRRSCLDEVGRFDESLFVHEDWDLWIRMATRYPFAHIAQTTAEFTWRTDGSSMTSRDQDAFSRTTDIIYRKYFPYAASHPTLLAAQQERLRETKARSSMPSFQCSIIIPVWNKVELTKQCLLALAKVTSGTEYEVILVDNGSTDGTHAFFQTLGGDVQVIRNQENLGFAKACNQGALAAHGDYLVFLNNDTIPLTNWLQPLVSEVEEHPEVGIVGSKLLFPDGTVQHAGVVLDRSSLAPYHIYRTFPGDTPAVNQRREFQIVTGACLLIRRTVFEKVGGFDNGFLNGFEDVDLCLKVRDEGWQVVYQPRSTLYHLESQTPGRKANESHNSARLHERWDQRWWQGDEDLHYLADGYKLLRSEQNGAQRGTLQLISDIKDRMAWTHVAAAQAAALKQDWAGVRRELGLVQDWPADPYVLSWAAMVCEKLTEPALQQAFLSRYLELTDAPSVRLSLARILLAQKDLAGAGEHLQKLLAVCPMHAEGLLLQGILCMQHEQYTEAECAFSSALRQGADRKKCLMGMGMASLGRAYAQGAWERFLQVLAENPDDAEAIHWILRAGTAQNRWVELSHQLRNYLSRNPGDLAARFALASVLVRADQVDAARQECEALRALVPTYDGLSELGQAITGKETVLAMEATHS